VFFVVSLIHVRVGFTSIHLLMNGLIGIVLGPRAALAIFCGLFLQYWLMPVPHGGLQTLGVNTCVLALPAVLAWGLLRLSHRLPWLKHSWCRSSLVMVSAALWLFSLIFSVSLLWTNTHWQVEALTFEIAWGVTTQPVVILTVAVISTAAAWIERRLENSPEFALGLLLGELAVLLTVGLNFAVLRAGGEQYWPLPPLVLLVAHLPIAVFEGIVMGFTLGFLAKVKPELVGIARN
jgi:ABC-type Co2+ transport system permease subunit